MQSGHQNPVEFSEWLFEKSHVIEVAAFDSCGFKAELNGRLGKTEVVLDARETFLFRSSDQLTIVQERGGGVVIVAGNSENIHLALVTSPSSVDGFLRMLEPICGSLLDI